MLKNVIGDTFDIVAFDIVVTITS